LLGKRQRRWTLAIFNAMCLGNDRCLIKFRYY
jgi:hypothetical protein